MTIPGLQKCIRRSLPDPAVRTARHLLELDPVKLLRRIPIIVVEDVAVHVSPVCALLLLLCCVVLC